MRKGPYPPTSAIVPSFRLWACDQCWKKQPGKKLRKWYHRRSGKSYWYCFSCWNEWEHQRRVKYVSELQQVNTGYSLDDGEAVIDTRTIDEDIVPAPYVNIIDLSQDDNVSNPRLHAMGLTCSESTVVLPGPLTSSTINNAGRSIPVFLQTPAPAQ